jgi:hypothetical protein
MKKIKIFDLDDTLIKPIYFYEFINIENGQIQTENEDIKNYIKKIKNIFYLLFAKELCFEKNNDFIIILDCRNKKPLGGEFLDFIQDLSLEKLKEVGLKFSIKKDLLRALEEKNQVLNLRPQPDYYNNNETIGIKVNNEIFEIYKNCENKMIVTGRGEKMRLAIEQRLKDLKIEFPNYGLHLFPGGSKGIADYKVKVIQDSIINNGWEEVHFFEDRNDWLEKAYIETIEKFPGVKFHKHLVTKIK